MARTKAVLGSGARLSDYLSASKLARVYPAELVHSILDEHGRNSLRIRSFPAVAGVYYCMALSLYPEAAYEEVFAVVAQGLAWAAGAAEPKRVAGPSITKVRHKIGVAPLLSLMQRSCVALADASVHPEAFFAGLRLVAFRQVAMSATTATPNQSVKRTPNSGLRPLSVAAYLQR